MPLDPGRTVAELRELQALTGDEHGAQRLAWTETWARAREWLREKAGDLPVEYEVDEAGNQWWTLAGVTERALLVGGHIDSVPNGGWLDGCLNVVAGLEVLRRLAGQGDPPVTVRLVNWADEEGARFVGRGLFGSMSAAGAMDPELHRTLRDWDGVPLVDALAAYGIDLDGALEARRQLRTAAAYAELHIEQGPVLERLGLPLGVVLGTVGLSRHGVRFAGQTAHAGSTPIVDRRDAFLAAARWALEVREIARRHDGVCTIGSVIARPGIVTAVPGICETTIDQRHLDAGTLAAMVAGAKEAAERIVREERVELGWEPAMQIPPQPFHPELIELAEQAVLETAGVCHRLPSGPLHDATYLAASGVPTVMLFVQSLNGLSHAKEEDTKEEHLHLAVQALDRLVEKLAAWVAARNPGS